MALPTSIGLRSEVDGTLEFLLRVPATDPDFCIHFSLSAQNTDSWFGRLATLMLAHRDSRCVTVYGLWLASKGYDSPYSHPRLAP